jgi:hypothetical protein
MASVTRTRVGWMAGSVAAVLALSCLAAGAQAGGQASGTAAPAEKAKPLTLEELAGTYEGTAHGPDGDMAVSVVLRVESGKLAGTIATPTDVLQVVGAALAEDKVTITVDMGGMVGSLNGRYDAGALGGSWEMAGQAGTFAIKKSAPAPASASVAGEWTGEAVVQGGPMPFTLVLRVEGENVTGEIGSAQGTSPLSGTWKDGTLAFSFAYMSGAPVSMGATVQDGRLVGVLDYNTGEVQGTWSASRKQSGRRRPRPGGSTREVHDAQDCLADRVPRGGAAGDAVGAGAEDGEDLGLCGVALGARRADRRRPARGGIARDRVQDQGAGPAG